MLPTANVLQRTFQLKFDDSQGTCFTIDIDNRQYIVTAKHLVKTIADRTTLEIKHEEVWKNLEVNLVGHCEGEIDISVLATGIQLSPTHPLPAGDMGMVVLGQDVLFLGFPYGIATNVGETNRDFPVPLVKKAIVSAFDTPPRRSFLLDGHNNPGFSGGPVVFSQVEKSSTDLSVAGVISGYQRELESVYMEEQKTPLAYRSNTGIIIAYSIKHAVDLIEQNPVGFQLPT